MDGGTKTSIRTSRGRSKNIVTRESVEEQRETFGNWHPATPSTRARVQQPSYHEDERRNRSRGLGLGWFGLVVGRTLPRSQLHCSRSRSRDGFPNLHSTCNRCSAPATPRPASLQRIPPSQTSWTPPVTQFMSSTAHRQRPQSQRRERRGRRMERYPCPVSYARTCCL